MVDTLKYYYSKLSTDTALIAEIGSGDIVNAYPNTVENFPLVIFLDDNQSDAEFADNEPGVASVSLTVHIFTKALVGYPTTTTLGMHVARIFGALRFSCGSNGEVPDDTDAVRHRVMRFSKGLFPSEL